MKKIISFALALVMLLGIAGCSGQPTVSQTEEDSAAPAVTDAPDDTPIENGGEEQTGEPGLHYAESYAELYAEIRSRAEQENGRWTYERNEIMDAVPEAPADDGGYVENSGKDFSGTNVQVEGIDEGDIVKTDGEYIYLICASSSELIILEADGENSGFISRTTLGGFKASGTAIENINGHAGVEKTPRELFIFGDTLAVIYECYSWNDIAGPYFRSAQDESRVEIEFYDVSDRNMPKLAGTFGQDGNILGTRLYDNRLYVISRWNVYESEFEDITKSEDVIPALYSSEDRRLIPAGNICICPGGTQLSYVVAAVYDMRGRELLDCESVLGGGSEVYMSGENVYVFGRAWTDGAGEAYMDGVYTVVDYAPSTNTSILCFAVTDKGLKLEAQGTVPGYMDSRFSADEYEGYLRIVTTVHRSAYSVYTDEARGFVNFDEHTPQTETTGLYILDAALNIVGSVEELAPGEQLYSARFDGEMAYFCTFETVDPLFAVDCSIPEDPKVLSALKISGFSDYLHSWSDGMLFGFGYEADEHNGWLQGLKLVMFDTRNKADVTVAASVHLENVYFSAALSDPHAMFIRPEKNLIGFPADGEYYIYSYDAENGFYQRCRLQFRSWDYQARGLYIGDAIYILGTNGGYVLDMDSFGVIKEIYW